MSPPDNRVPSKYQERAWTFQEQLMSRRAIHFASGAIEWQCNHGSQAEYDLLLPDHLYKRSDFQFQSITRNMPTPMGLNTAIGLYNQRELSFPEDAFAAFAGVQSMLERNHADRFLYGLPGFWRNSSTGIRFPPPCLIEANKKHRRYKQRISLPEPSVLTCAARPYRLRAYGTNGMGTAFPCGSYDQMVNMLATYSSTTARTWKHLNHPKAHTQWSLLQLAKDTPQMYQWSEKTGTCFQAKKGLVNNVVSEGIFSEHPRHATSYYGSSGSMVLLTGRQAARLLQRLGSRIERRSL
ncbi:unnamed protein product [Alternaria alternata]